MLCGQKISNQVVVTLGQSLQPRVYTWDTLELENGPSLIGQPDSLPRPRYCPQISSKSSSAFFEECPFEKLYIRNMVPAWTPTELSGSVPSPAPRLCARRSARTSRIKWGRGLYRLNVLRTRTKTRKCKASSSQRRNA